MFRPMIKFFAFALFDVFPALFPTTLAFTKGNQITFVEIYSVILKIN